MAGVKRVMPIDRCHERDVTTSMALEACALVGRPSQGAMSLLRGSEAHKLTVSHRTCRP